MEKFRKLKTQKKYIGGTYNLRVIPQLLLKGQWLLDAGFEPGINCSLKVEKGRITILSL